MPRLILALAVLLAFWPSPAAAQGKAKGKGRSTDYAHGKDKSKERSKDHARQKARCRSSKIGIDLHVRLGKDRDLIRRYVGGYKGGGLPPGLSKRGGALPPGLEKHLRRNGRLPPGLEKKVTAFPPGLESRLSPLPSHLRRGFLEGRGVVFDRSTSAIVDIFIP